MQILTPRHKATWQPARGQSVFVVPYLFDVDTHPAALYMHYGPVRACVRYAVPSNTAPWSTARLRRVLPIALPEIFSSPCLPSDALRCQESEEGGDDMQGLVLIQGFGEGERERERGRNGWEGGT